MIYYNYSSQGRAYLTKHHRKTSDASTARTSFQILPGAQKRTAKELHCCSTSVMFHWWFGTGVGKCPIKWEYWTSPHSSHYRPYTPINYKLVYNPHELIVICVS